MNSDYCTRIELKDALQHSKESGANVIPILAATCDWRALPVSDRHALPIDKMGQPKPLNKWGRDVDVAFTQIAAHVRAIAEARGAWTVQPTKSVDPMPSTKAPRTAIVPEVEDSLIHNMCSIAFYSWRGCSAEAIRLVGAQSEVFPVDRIATSIVSTPFHLPAQLAKEAPRIIEYMENHAKREGKDLWNGDCVRLIDHRASPRDNTEAKHLELTLGPLKWYDYMVANQTFGDNSLRHFTEGKFSVNEFIDFERLILDRSIKSCVLSNILTTYLTITTTDGYVCYSERSGRVGAHPRLLISAVSENIHPENDETFATENPISLFRTAARGINEELSPLLQPRSAGAEILLLGLEFHLQAYHPGLLFYLPLSHTRAAMERACQECPGKDFAEGSLRFVHVNDEAAIMDVLSRENWFHAGKASLIRTLEYLETSASGRGISVMDYVTSLFVS
jgi:hypothetical protein